MRKKEMTRIRPIILIIMRIDLKSHCKLLFVIIFKRQGKLICNEKKTNLAQSNHTLLRTNHTALQQQEIVLDNSVMRETTLLRKKLN